MKKISYILILFISFYTNIYAQKILKGDGILGSEKRQTESYDQIHLYGSFEIEIIDGAEGNLTITGDSNLLPYVETKVVNEILTVRLKNNHNYNIKKTIRVYVPVEDISKIILTGSGEITSKNKFTDSDIHLILKGSGEISLNVDCDDITAEVNGSGKIKLKGAATLLNATVKGSGNIIANNLKVETGILQVTGSGDIEAQISKDARANIIGSGDILVTGSPNKIVREVKGSGSIKMK
jgi:hypothetical protein